MKKAKIDVLDIDDSFDERPAEPPSPPQLEMEEPQIDLEGESFLVSQPDAKAPPKWRHITWKTLMLYGIPSVSLVLIVAAVVIYFLYYDKKSVFSAAKASKEVTATASGFEAVHFDNLTALIKDQTGKQRVVVFSIAVMQGKGGRPNIKEGDQDIRIATMRIVSASPFSELINEQGRNQVKKKIKDYVDGVKGPGTAENVWITSWMIL
jgi:flagellar basal body-associated protein FliL